MRDRFIGILTLFIMLLGFSTAYALNSCEQNLAGPENGKTASLGGGPIIPYTHISTSGAHVKSSIFGDTRDLILGFNELGHVYVMNEDVRIDGDMIGRRAHLHGKTHFIDSGILIRIKAADVDKEKLRALKDRMGISCAGTACTALARAGAVYVGSKWRRFYRADSLLRAVFERGLFDSSGRQVPYQVYYVGNGSLEKTYQKIEANSSHFAFTYGIAGPAVALGGAGILGLTLLDFLR